MDRHEDTRALLAIATEAFAALGNTHQISPFSARPAGLGVEDAYRVTPLVRQMYEAEGARAVGRKIGFTNRTIWSQYGVYAPIWGHVFDRSVHALAAVEALPRGAKANSACRAIEKRTSRRRIERICLWGP